MADQCIVCLENLDVQQPSTAPLQGSSDSEPGSAPSPSEPPVVPEAANVAVQPHLQSKTDGLAATTTTTTTNNNNNNDSIAEIQVCGHVLHDSCLREWTGKANSCPICRQTFHFVNVYDKVGGTKLSSYTVQDKKQTADFDAHVWLDENPVEDEPTRPCPICERSDHEEVLLLCDSCDAPYHTYCVGLDRVPRGHWLCMECADEVQSLLREELADPDANAYGLGIVTAPHSDYLPRTQATMRRARRRARSDEWQGAWGEITGHVFDALNIDLDNHDDDEALQNYRRSQRRRERERQEYQRWQQRLNIASRLGAGDAFVSNLPRVLPQPIRPQPPPPPQETPEERKAWGALEKAMEATGSGSRGSSGTSTSSRKRKSRSATASPREPPQQPERRLKRPRTRRVPQATGIEASLSTPQNGAPSSSARVAQPVQPAQSVSNNGVAPSFLSSLLNEVETSTQSDDENVRNFFGSLTRPTANASSPATSPSPSGHNSPRALSTTPPPRGINDRPGSPLALSSHIEPLYPPANFSPNRNGADHSGSDSETRVPRQRQRPQNGADGASRNSDVRHPRPRRLHANNNSTTTSHVSRSPESSPTRGSLSLKTKESINAIIKAALKPHYKSGNITADQYTAINRGVSRKLYQEVPEESLDDDTRRRCEKTATQEVAKAVSDLREIKV
ncbi:hypothetical protein BJ170DRAFT_379005 [Xylariales sp. AK1849]|nr:hypothetical protein BJ170DRAFT_379005 [Xylariales sp. AK1849]